MRILIVDTHNTGNPFSEELYKELLHQQINVVLNNELFWFADKNEFDIIHFQWPEAIFNWDRPNLRELKFLEERLAFWKKRSKLVYTCHNDKPHYKDSPILNKLYDIVEQDVDGFIHMGEFSKKKFESKYPQKKHSIIEHHVYDHTYPVPERIDKNEARSQLGISKNKFVILTFGAYRAEEEKNKVLAAFSRAKIPTKLLLAPRLNVSNFKVPSIYRYLDKWILEKVKTIFYNLKGIVISKDEFIPSNKLPLYFIASDIVLLQRFKILNSGNLPMAFWFKKPVIGPNKGNIGELLTKTNNYIFDTENLNSITQILENSFAESQDIRSENNFRYAIDQLTTKNCVSKLIKFYHSVLATH